MKKVNLVNELVNSWLSSMDGTFGEPDSILNGNYKTLESENKAECICLNDKAKIYVTDDVRVFAEMITDLSMDDNNNNDYGYVDDVFVLIKY
jgi:hypothetical protein